MSVVKNLTTELTTGLPPWAKGVATIAILGGVGYGIYKIIQNINKIDDKIDDKKEETALKKQGQKNWYSASQYKEMANTFEASSKDTYNLFDKGNEDALYKLAGQIKSDLDFIEIRKAFGERRCTFTIDYMPLSAYISCMYDADEIEQANKILANNRVNYKF